MATLTAGYSTSPIHLPSSRRVIPACRCPQGNDLQRFNIRFTDILFNQLIILGPSRITLRLKMFTYLLSYFADSLRLWDKTPAALSTGSRTFKTSTSMSIGSNQRNGLKQSVL
jgi:hypothetical protein